MFIRIFFALCLILPVMEVQAAAPGNLLNGFIPPQARQIDGAISHQSYSAAVMQPASGYFQPISVRHDQVTIALHLLEGQLEFLGVRSADQLKWEISTSFYYERTG